MRAIIYFFLLCSICFANYSAAQVKCASFEYQQRVGNNPVIAAKRGEIENFVQARLQYTSSLVTGERPAEATIKIPVIVHVVYHLPGENIPDEMIFKQVAALNRDYRKHNKDTIKTPSVFKQKAADCNIEFELAKVDPKGRATTGIERVYTPVLLWEADDKVKYKLQLGADAWDSRYYLNIWICNLDRVLGYSSLPGDDPKNDGIVLNFIGVHNQDDGSAYGLGRTAVHETGHWLGLKHLWGDADCGDDGVDDTPRQTSFTSGCPEGTRLSCGQAAGGDMYMNFMDYTNDPCTNLFTKGQSKRMRVLFDEGGARYSIRASKALGLPWLEEIPLPDNAPQWLSPRVYPNPANDAITIDLRYDARWIGKELSIINTAGQEVMRHLIISSKETVDIRSLKPGVYFIRGKKDNERLAQQFVKM